MFERCLYFNTNTLARKLNALWENAFAQFELAPSHAYLLRLILSQPGLNQQELATELKLNKSTITRFLSVLESKELIVRKDVKNDLRGNSIFPSSKAIKLQKPLEELGSSLYAAMCNAIGKEEVESFVKISREINQKLTD